MIEADFMAKRYGVLPSEFLGMDLKDYQFNMLAARLGVESEAKEAKKMRQSKRGK